LVKSIKKKKSCICVGLDPRQDLLPKKFNGNILRFNKAVIDLTRDIAVCIKPQIAFYEVLGPKGLGIFYETCEYGASRGLVVIADVKRSDIADTAKYYAKTYLKRDSIDAVTLNPFLGSDSMEPFVEGAAESLKGIFMLVKTSNPSSSEIQDKVRDELIKITKHFAPRLRGKTGYSSMGIVVGATHPEEIVTIRNSYQEGFFLVPGFGFQGGDASMVRAAFNQDGLGAVINASRSITYPANSDWSNGVRDAAIKMRDGINSCL
jgi:orotidine-5'-phosphate decarboxylase